MTKSEQFAQEQMARLADMFRDMTEERCSGCTDGFATGRRHGLKLASESLGRMHALFRQLLESERLEDEREDKLFKGLLAGVPDPRDKSN
jgi:flagellar biosynthesis/type III secretory pathway protein FliH